MTLFNIINRKAIPNPWEEGDNIPWNDPDFSKRMLKEHLSQAHDAASRKFNRIDLHVRWIHKHVLQEQRSRILDLACGPGLYNHRLSRLGHQCQGIDYSPASIAYARQIAQEDELDCTFIEADLREAEYGRDYDSVMLIYGELNVFKPTQAELILKKAFQALHPGGILILEPLTFESVQEWGSKPPSWYSATAGLNSPEPHLVLEDYFWNPDERVTTNRYFVIEAHSANVIRYAQSLQAYTKQDFNALLEKVGYTGIHFYPSLTGEPDPKQAALIAILAQKPGEL